MSIAKDGLHPPGTTNILTPSPVLPCFSTTSLNFLTALSVKLTILPPCCNSEPLRSQLNYIRIFYITSIFTYTQLFFRPDPILEHRYAQRNGCHDELYPAAL